MNVVSYTRAVSDTYIKINGAGSPGCGIPKLREKISISEQNAKIDDFAKAKGWKITKRYSDRKENREADEAYKQLRDDVVDRKVDCLIINSVYYGGPGITAAKDLLKNVLFPAGIPFYILEDNFSSEGKSYVEVDRFFKEKINQMRSMIASRVACSWYEDKKYLKYGFIWVSDDEYEIDPEAADVVRLVFDQALQGKTTLAIAEYLNNLNIEGENAYRIRKSGKARKGGSLWNETQIRNMLNDTCYMGRLEKTLGKNKVIRDCPVIIDEQLFLEVQRIKAKRTLGNPGNRLNDNPFKYRISDKETGVKLVIYSGKDGPIYRFMNPAPVIDYPKKSIRFSAVEQAYIKMMKSQKEMAKIAADKINSSEGREVYETRRSNLFVQCKNAFEKLCLIRASCDEETMKSFEKANKEFEHYYAKMEHLNQVFSLDNKWIKKFINADPGEELKYETVKKYLEKIYVERFEQVTAIPVHKDWFDQLPAEWFNLEE